MTTSSEREPLSAIIAEMLGSQVVTVGEVADRVAQRGFGLIMSVLALPTMIPVLPPGSAAFIGLLYILLAVQMLIGLPRPWLPVRVRNYRLTSGTMRMLQERGIPLLRRVERLARPRATWVPDALVTRAVAVAVLLLGIVLFSPLPFFNTIPAMTVLILGIGLFNRDSLFLLGGVGGHGRCGGAGGRRRRHAHHPRGTMDPAPQVRAWQRPTTFPSPWRERDKG